VSLLLRMAWRNLFRNRRRTLLTSTIIAMGLACLILTDAIVLGLVDSMVATATDSFLGQAQVHADRFRVEGKVEQTIPHLPSVVRHLQRDPSVAAFSQRTLSMSMVASATGAESVMLYGVDPEHEKDLSILHRSIQSGQFLDASRGPGILLGSRLAHTLQASVGDRIVVTCAKAGTGELSQEMLRVAGIFSFHTALMDRNVAFIGLDRSQKMLGLGSGVHEVALRFKEGNGSEPVHASLLKALGEDGNEALPWTQLLPELKTTIEISSFAALLLAILLAVLVALAILNTQFMALYERMYEFGVLRSLGTRPLSLATLVVLEAACMGLLSVLLGMVFGVSITHLVDLVGIDYTGVEYAGVTFQGAIHPQNRWVQFTYFPLGVWLFTVLIACYPASHAYRILPAKAMHRSLG
jgi:ABC-type lipoprotein release transport system permease subunit